MLVSDEVAKFDPPSAWSTAPLGGFFIFREPANPHRAIRREALL